MALPGVPQAPIAGDKTVSAPWFAWFLALKALIDGHLLVGNGSPAGVVVARRGTLFLRIDGGAGSTLWVKEANDGLASGWRAV